MGGQHGKILLPVHPGGRGAFFGSGVQCLFGKHQKHQQAVDPLGEYRGNGGTGGSHYRKAQFPENENVIDHRVDPGRSHTGIEGKLGLFHAPQEGGQQCCSRQRQIGSGDDEKVGRGLLAGGGVFGVQPHDLTGEQDAQQGKQPRNAHRQQQVGVETPADFLLIVLPQILGNHDPRHGTYGGHDDGVDGRKFSCQPHTGHADAAQLTDHDLIHDAERRLQHGLQCHGNGQRADATEKGFVVLHRDPSLFVALIVQQKFLKGKG